MTDVEGAHLASVQSIGYANEPGKRERLTAAGAGAIINSLADLALSAPRTHSQSGAVTTSLYGFKGAPSARQADRPRPDSRRMRRTCTESVNEPGSAVP